MLQLNTTNMSHQHRHALLLSLGSIEIARKIKETDRGVLAIVYMAYALPPAVRDRCEQTHAILRFTVSEKFPYHAPQSAVLTPTLSGIPVTICAPSEIAWSPITSFSSLAECCLEKLARSTSPLRLLRTVHYRFQTVPGMGDSICNLSTQWLRVLPPSVRLLVEDYLGTLEGLLEPEALASPHAHWHCLLVRAPLLHWQR